MSNPLDSKLNFSKPLSDNQRLNFGEDDNIEYYLLEFLPDINLRRYTRFVLRFSIKNREEENNIRFFKMKLKSGKRVIKSSSTKFLTADTKDTLTLETKDILVPNMRLGIEMYIEKIKDNEDYGLENLQFFIGRDYEPYDGISNAL